MVIGWSRWEENGAAGIERFPWKRVEAAQLRPQLPCLLVPQPAHAVLAGDLANALLPKAFGSLPAEIRQAILMHDTGWAMIDAAQIQHLRSGATRRKPSADPVSFVASSPKEAIEAWTASINSVERLCPSGGLIVSRHFTLLATQPEHRQFVASERDRQQRLESRYAAAAGDVGRWIAALGFCDLLSLYLLCGFRNGASFALAHPASSEARSAPRVALEVSGELLYFTPRIFHAGARLELEVLRHPVAEHEPRFETLRWEIA